MPRDTRHTAARLNLKIMFKAPDVGHSRNAIRMSKSETRNKLKRRN